jgi:dihydroneopterin aldolase
MRSGRISRPPTRLIETAYAAIQETYLNNFHDMGENDMNGKVECTYAMKALLFQKEMQKKPIEAMKALREEVIKAIKIDIWDAVHLEDLSAEEKKLVIPQMN